MRGEHSDILSRETVDTMRVSRPDLVAIEVSGQGHAPLLIGSEAIDPIVEFVSTIDR
jgi:hypothetical protein